MKSRSILVVLMIATLPFGLRGQTMKIIYEERANIENQLKGVTDPATRARVSAYLAKPATTYLYYKDGVSVYNNTDIEGEAKGKSNELSVVNKEEKRVEIGRGGSGVYKSQPENLYLKEADLVGKEFLVKDELSKIDWKLSNEAKKIGSFDCKKATAVVDGEPIIAWYTPSVPISDGPADFYGLPGLIVELTATKKTYHALKIEKQPTDYVFQKPSKGKVISRVQYKNEVEQMIKELRQGAPIDLNGQ